MQEDSMQSIIQGQISFIPVIILIIAIAAIILILLFLKVYQIRHRAGKEDQAKILGIKPPAEIITQFPDSMEIKEDNIAEKKQQDEKIQLVDLGDISRNLHSLASKYHLGAITLSTTDGLMIATTSDSGQDDAAHYGQALTPGEVPSVPGMRLFEITHKGSSVIGIIRSDHLITDSSLVSIRKDTEKIMNWWI
jgi:hypothetical protein